MTYVKERYCKWHAWRVGIGLHRRRLAPTYSELAVPPFETSKACDSKRRNYDMNSIDWFHYST